MYYLKARYENYGAARTRNAIQYIVVHYTGGNGDTARNNCTYFNKNVTKTSAHYFIDENEICCSVPYDRIAYSVGANVYRHAFCRNFNSINIEMCSRKNSAGNYYIPSKTIDRTAKFVRQLMKDYNIPLNRVLRHYDVSGKQCPAPFVTNPASWEYFKTLLKEGETMKYYEKLSEIPAGELRETVEKLIDAGIVRGTTDGLHLSEDMVRMFVFNNRAGLYKEV